MKRKLLVGILSLTAVIAGALGLTACGGGGHPHTAIVRK